MFFYQVGDLLALMIWSNGWSNQLMMDPLDDFINLPSFCFGTFIKNVVWSNWRVRQVDDFIKFVIWCNLLFDDICWFDKIGDVIKITILSDLWCSQIWWFCQSDDLFTSMVKSKWANLWVARIHEFIKFAIWSTCWFDSILWFMSFTI